jgi:hypothetical protein
MHPTDAKYIVNINDARAFIYVPAPEDLEFFCVPATSTPDDCNVYTGRLGANPSLETGPFVCHFARIILL